MPLFLRHVRARFYNRDTLPSDDRLSGFAWLSILTEEQVQRAHEYARRVYADRLSDSAAVEAVRRNFPGGVRAYFGTSDKQNV